MVSKLLLALYMSISFRSANVANAPYDWEGIIGYQVPNQRREYMRERENGRHYYGIQYFKRYEFKNCLLELEDYKKTARDIDTQKTVLKIPRDAILRIGTAGATDRWKVYQQRIGAYLDYAGLSAGIETHFNGVDAYHAQFRKVIWESETKINVQLEPLLIYKCERDNIFWQAKLRLVFGVKK